MKESSEFRAKRNMLIMIRTRDLSSNRHSRIKDIRNHRERAMKKLIRLGNNGGNKRFKTSVLINNNIEEKARETESLAKKLSIL